MIRFACVVFILQWPLLCRAVDYTITLAPVCTDSTNPDCGYNDNGPEDNDFDVTKPWRTWGTTGYDRANFLNNAASPIGAVWFKALYPGHTFSDKCAGPKLFREVWVNKTRTEIIFRGATAPVASGNYFWMKAVPRTGGSEDYYQFSAKFYTDDPAIPADGGWYQLPNIVTAAPRTNSKCSSYASACCRPSICVCRRRFKCRLR